jgi:hypothetical protein
MPLHTLSRSRRYSINDYGMTTPFRGDTPSNYNLIAWWKASSLLGTYTDGQTVVSWPDVTAAVTATAVNTPTFATNDAGFGKPAVVFNGSSYFNLSPSVNLTDANTAGTWTVAFVIRTTADSQVLGVGGQNVQMRRRRSGANNISVYNGSSEVTSTTFSGDINSPSLCWYVASAATIRFYESAATRGGPSGWSNYVHQHNQLGTTGIGGTMSGAVAELCIWKQALTADQITSLYSTYFTVQYPAVLY